MEISKENMIEKAKGALMGRYGGSHAQYADFVVKLQVEFGIQLIEYLSSGLDGYESDDDRRDYELTKINQLKSQLSSLLI